jgi:hypothetical protein
MPQKKYTEKEIKEKYTDYVSPTEAEPINGCVVFLIIIYPVIILTLSTLIMLLIGKL